MQEDESSTEEMEALFSQLADDTLMGVQGYLRSTTLNNIVDIVAQLLNPHVRFFLPHQNGIAQQTVRYRAPQGSQIPKAPLGEGGPILAIFLRLAPDTRLRQCRTCAQQLCSPPHSSRRFRRRGAFPPLRYPGFSFWESCFWVSPLYV